MITGTGHGARLSPRPLTVLLALVAAATLLTSCSDGDDAADTDPGSVGSSDAGRSDGAADTDRGLLDDTTEAHYDSVDDLPDAAALADTYALDWPASTRDIDLLQGGFQDPYYLARFTIDAADLDQLLGPALCHDLAPVTTGGFPTSFGGPEWWTPEEAGSGCEGQEPSSVQGIGVVDGEGTELTVYVAVGYV